MPGPVDWSTVRNVLLIRLRSIGDTVLMTPCLAALKSLNPSPRIAVLSEPAAAPLLENHPLVDELIICERSAESRLRALQKIRRSGFDVAFNLHGGTTATWLARLSGARHTAGYRGYRHAGLLDLKAPDPDVILGRGQVHSVEQQLALLHWTGVPWPSPIELGLTASESARNLVQKKLATPARSSPDAFAIVAPAARFESKRWTESGFAETARHLERRWNLRPIILAGPGEEGLAERVSRSAAAAMLTGLSLAELMALISMCSIFVGNDGGPMHIAAAFRRPLAAVFGSSNPKVWHPWTDSPYRVIGGASESSRRDTDQPDSDGDFAVRKISAPDVIAATDELLLEAASDDSTTKARRTVDS